MKVYIQGIAVNNLTEMIKTIKTLDENQIIIKKGLSNFDYLYAQLNLDRTFLKEKYNSYESYNKLTVNYITNNKLKNYIKKII